jgi:hypothetical protein
LLCSSFFSLYEIITEEDETGLITDPGTCMEKCITVATRERLTDIGDIREMRDSLHQGEFFDLSLLDERLFEFERRIEMILDRLLTTTRHDHDISDACGNSLFDEILDDWLIDDREHFFGLGFCSRQKAGPKTRCWYDTFPYFLHEN